MTTWPGRHSEANGCVTGSNLSAPLPYVSCVLLASPASRHPQDEHNLFLAATNTSLVPHDVESWMFHLSNRLSSGSRGIPTAPAPIVPRQRREPDPIRSEDPSAQQDPSCRPYLQVNRRDGTLPCVRLAASVGFPCLPTCFPHDAILEASGPKQISAVERVRRPQKGGAATRSREKTPAKAPALLIGPTPVHASRSVSSHQPGCNLFVQPPLSFQSACPAVSASRLAAGQLGASLLGKSRTLASLEKSRPLLDSTSNFGNSTCSGKPGRVGTPPARPCALASFGRLQGEGRESDKWASNCLAAPRMYLVPLFCSVLFHSDTAISESDRVHLADTLGAKMGLQERGRRSLR